MKHLSHLLIAAALCGLPAAASAETPKFPLSVPPRPETGGPTPRVEKTGLRHLGVPSADLRFQGEVAVHRYPVYLSGAEAFATTTFRVAYRNSVAVLPEASTLSVTINGTTVGSTPIDGAGDTASAEFKVPPGLLVEGYNAVRIVAKQQHRVDCSIPGTWELTTRLDPAATGFVTAAAEPSIRTVADLQKVPGSGDGALVFRVARTDAGDTAAVSDTLEAAQALALLAGAGKARVVFSGAEVSGTVVDLALADEARVRERFGAATTRVDQAPGVVVGRRSDGGDGLVLGVDPSRLADLVATAERFRPKGSPAGVELFGVGRGETVAAGETRHIPELGDEGLIFAGRFFRLATTVDMPSDFYAGGYGSAVLALSGAFAPGLAAGDTFTVRVNGMPIGDPTLLTQTGGTFEGRTLRLPYSMFKAGGNTIEFEVALAKPSDAVCSPARAFDEPRFGLGADTTLTFEPFARATNAPNLGATLADGDLFAAAGEPLTVDVSASDPRYLDVAATFVMRVSTASRKVRPVDLAFGRRSGADRSAIFVGPLDEAWVASDVEKEKRARKRIDVAEISSTVGLGAVTDVAPRPGVGARLIADRMASVGSPALPSIAGFTSPLRGLDRLTHTAVAEMRRWGNLAVERLTPRDPDLEPDRSVPTGALVITQQTALPTGETPWSLFWRSLLHGRGGVGTPMSRTTITAVDADALVRGFDRLVDRNDWNRVDGASTAYDPDSGRITVRTPGGGLFLADSARSFGNLRLLAAGWFARNNLFYLLSVLACCTLLGALAISTVRRRAR